VERAYKLIGMQLRAARLCMDCEEIHDSQKCPACGSETFAYISRWIPTPERRQQPGPQEAAEAYRELLSPAPPAPGLARWLRRGAVGMAAVAAVGWAWQRRRGTPSPTGESANDDDTPVRDKRDAAYQTSE
jgi:hypothetical protein